VFARTAEGSSGAGPAPGRTDNAASGQLGPAHPARGIPPHALDLIVVFDGLSPAVITPDRCPWLCSVRERSSRFTSARAQLPSVTRVNAATLATGVRPGRHGLVGNSVRVRELGLDRGLWTSDRYDLLAVEKACGSILLAPTMGELLAAAGRRTVVVNTGSAGVSLLLDPTAHRDGPGIRVNTRDAEPLAEPAWAAEQLRARLGVPGDDRAGQLRYAVDALAYLIEAHRPDVAVLWLTEPDASQHRYGPGSAQSLAALAAADAALGRLVDALEALGRADDTNLWVASDHGSSPMTGRVNLAEELTAAGFDRGVCCCDDGTSAIWLDDPADPVAERLVTWLRRQPWTGVLFGADGLPGTVPLSVIGAAGPRSPQLFVGYAPGWYSAQAGPTTDAPDWHGGHGSGYRRDVHSVLQVTGPDYRRDVDLTAPAGLVDVLPTIAAGLGVDADFDGRVLTEARPGGPVPAATSSRLALPGARASVTRVAGVSYVDEIVPDR
jgi:hypothetical protein